MDELSRAGAAVTDISNGEAEKSGNCFLDFHGAFVVGS